MTNLAGFDNAMSNKRRELYFKILESFNLLNEICPRLYFLNEHFPQHKTDRALEWLIAHQYTGRAFVSWFKSTCKDSDLEMHRQLLAVVDNAPIGPIVAGRNFIT